MMENGFNEYRTRQESISNQVYKDTYTRDDTLKVTVTILTLGVRILIVSC